MGEVMNNNLDQYNRYKYVIENIKDIIWELDTNLVFTFVSPTAKGMVGYEADEIVGRSLLDFLTKESKEYVLDQFKQNAQSRTDDDSKKIILYDVQFVCKDGKIIWAGVCLKPVFKEKSFTGYIGTTRDISEKKEYENELKKYNKELESANRKLEEMATFDMLTGAYNRRKFEYYIRLSVERKEEHGSPFSIIMFDIDYFKQVNDLCGHNKGDQILQEISAIVKHTLRDTDKLFRWGGEEFIILLPEITSKNAYKVAEKVRKAIESYNFGIQNSKVTVSVGVGEYKTGESMDQFVSCVDNALLKAKANGKNRVEFG